MLSIRRALVVLLAVSVVSGASASAASPFFVADLAAAQESTPSATPEIPPLPAAGTLVAEEALTETGPFRPYFCPTGRNQGTASPDGYRLAVTGRCAAELPYAGVRVFGTGVTVGDGDVELEVRGTGATDRVILALYLRVQENGDGYEAAWDPTLGRASLRRVGDGSDENAAVRTDLGSTSLADGARIGVRARGQTLWLLLNGEPVLAMTDAQFDTGGIGLAVARRGSADDDAEVAIIWRNLRLAALADGDAGRAPTYQPPARAATAQASPTPRQVPPFVPITGSPPALGPAVLSVPLAEPAPSASFQCQTGHGATESTGEGLRIWLNGPCHGGARRAVLPTLLGPLVVVPDGEVRFEFKVTAGPERVLLTVRARGQGISTSAPYAGYEMYVAPAYGVAGIAKTGDGSWTALSQREDLRSLLSLDGWNTVAVRMRGPELWLLLNDQPVVKIEDQTYASPATTGYTALVLERLGPIEDTADAEVVVRDLRVSQIEGGPRDRRPSHLGIPR